MQIPPFSFHVNLRDYFKKQTKTWQWFADNEIVQAQTEEFKTDLLKNTYRLDNESEPNLYKLLDTAKFKLGINLPITIYQSQSIDNNASIVIFNNEAHLVISGNILKLLTENELLALLGHELSHILLYTIEGGDFEVTSRIINTIANDHGSELYYHETARIFQLFTELYCDIGALKVCEDINTAITTLIKIHTGLEKVSAESYLKQTDEILERVEKGSAGESHPEIYLRAKAIQLYVDDKLEYESKIEKLIYGKKDISLLNLFSKLEVYNTTKDLVDIILKPKWTQSEHCVVLYKQYFKQFNIDSTAILNEEIKAEIFDTKENMQNYYAYVMLDFALCDYELREPFLGLILDIAEQIGIEKNLKKIIMKEFKLSEKTFKEQAAIYTQALNTILESSKENSY